MKDEEFKLALSKINNTNTNLDLSEIQLTDTQRQELAQFLNSNKVPISFNFYFYAEDDQMIAGIVAALENNTLIALDLEFFIKEGYGTQEIAKALKTNTTLTKLYLRANKIEEKVLKEIMEGLKTNTKLTAFHLSGMKITDGGAEAISEALKTNTTLTKFHLGPDSITERGLEVIAEGLETNTNLTAFHLSDMKIRDGGGNAIAKALKTNATLTLFHLSSVDIKREGFKAIMEALKTNATLTVVYLCSIDMSDKSLEAIAEALKDNKTLTTFELSNIEITQEPFKAIMEALAINTTLTKLNFYNNGIESENYRLVTEGIEKALETNTTLTELDWHSSVISYEGATAMAKALRTNKTLTALDLSDNIIENQGATAMAEALAINTTLTKLDLRDNGITDEGAERIAEALKTNAALTELDLRSLTEKGQGCHFPNKITDEGWEFFVDALKGNGTIISIKGSQNVTGITDILARNKQTKEEKAMIPDHQPLKELILQTILQVYKDNAVMSSFGGNQYSEFYKKLYELFAVTDEDITSEKYQDLTQFQDKYESSDKSGNFDTLWNEFVDYFKSHSTKMLYESTEGSEEPHAKKAKLTDPYEYLKGLEMISNNEEKAKVKKSVLFYSLFPKYQDIRLLGLLDDFIEDINNWLLNINPRELGTAKILINLLCTTPLPLKFHKQIKEMKDGLINKYEVWKKKMEMEMKMKMEMEMKMKIVKDYLDNALKYSKQKERTEHFSKKFQDFSKNKPLVDKIFDNIARWTLTDFRVLTDEEMETSGNLPNGDDNS